MNVKQPILSDKYTHSLANYILWISICISIFGQIPGSDIALSMPGIIENQGKLKCESDGGIDIYSDLRQKVNDTVLSLKGNGNGIIHEDISNIIRPYFSMANMDFIKANDIVAKACLSVFYQITTKSNIDRVLYRSYSVLERGFSSILSITIDIELESADNKYGQYKIKSYINFSSI